MTSQPSRRTTMRRNRRCHRGPILPLLNGVSAARRLGRPARPGRRSERTAGVVPPPPLPTSAAARAAASSPRLCAPRRVAAATCGRDSGCRRAARCRAASANGWSRTESRPAGRRSRRLGHAASRHGPLPAVATAPVVVPMLRVAPRRAAARPAPGGCAPAAGTGSAPLSLAAPCRGRMPPLGAGSGSAVAAAVARTAATAVTLTRLDRRRDWQAGNVRAVSWSR